MPGIKEIVLRTEILVTPRSAILLRDKHLELLYRVLKKHGYRIHPSSLAKLCKYNRAAIWHIHWIDSFHSGIIQRLGIKRDYMLISFLRFLYFIFAIALSKVTSVKILWTIHNVSSHAGRSNFFEALVTRILLTVSDEVTAVNDHIKSTICQRYHFKDIDLMRQGLYEDCYDNTITREQARRHLCLNKGDFVLLFLGIVQEYKGIDIAIRALELVDDPSVKLLIAGRLIKEAEYAEQIIGLAEKNENVILLDKFIPDEELQIFFKAADYTIYPYRRIDNSGTLYLTLTFEIPTIIRGAAGILEIIKLNPNVAIVIDEPDAQNVADAIKKARVRIVDIAEFSVFKQKLSWINLEDEILGSFNKLQN
jgi:beta-1,4-mannosyltransferase